LILAFSRGFKDDNAFKRVRVAFDTIEWDSGIDLDPEFVYAKCQGQKNAQLIVKAKRMGYGEESSDEIE
jgi:hypothetical protein